MKVVAITCDTGACRCSRRRGLRRRGEQKEMSADHLIIHEILGTIESFEGEGGLEGLEMKSEMLDSTKC